MPRQASRKQLLKIACERGLISKEQLEICLSVKGTDPVDAAVRRGFITREELDGLALMSSIGSEAKDDQEAEPRISADFWDDVSGKRFGPYELIEKIGQGASAVVIKAKDTRLGRTVALKVLQESALGIPSRVQRFTREAKAMASLRHPNIVAVHEIGSEQGWYYFSMDYVKGTPFYDVLSDTRIKLATILEIIEKIARGCDFAHNKGVVHRDLKPGNILLDENLEPFITDFGIARIAEQEERLTQTGTILGTAHYMSPEHVSGDPDRVEARSDVFSLGAIIYEAATGRPPFSGRGALGIYNAIATTDPIPPRRVVRTVSPDLEAIIMKALEKEPESRYRSAMALAEDLRRLREGLPIEATRISKLRLLARKASRHRIPLALGSLAAVAVIALVGIAAWEAYTRSKYEMMGDLEKDLEKRLGYYELAGAKHKAEAVRREIQLERMRRSELERQKEARERLDPVRSRVRGKLEEARRLRGEEGRNRAMELAGEVIEELRPLLIEYPESPELWVHLAGAYEILGDDERALESLDEAVKRSENSALPYIIRARFRIDQYIRVREPPGLQFRGTQALIGDPKEENVEAIHVRLLAEADIQTIRDRRFEFSRKYETLLEGARLLFEGKGEEAIELLSESIQLDRHDVLGWHLRGMGYFFLRDYDQAERDLNEALKLSLASAQQWIQRALARLGKGDFEGARADLDKAVELNPTSVRGFLLRGNLRYAVGDTHGSILDQTKVITLSPDTPSAWNNRGNAYYVLRDYPAAIRDLSKAIELEPNNPLYYSNLANCYVDSGDPKRAIEEQNRALGLEPGFAAAFIGRGRAKRALNDFAGAREDMDKGIALAPGMVYGWYQRALLRKSTGDPEGALDDMNAALKVNANDANMFIERANIFQQLARYKESIADYTEAIRLNPNLSAAWNNRGNSKSGSGDYDGAIEDFTQALKVDPGNYFALINRGIAYRVISERKPRQRFKLLRKAETDLAGFLELAPEDSPHRSAIEQELKNIREALKAEEY
jgi:tetratricopeptide (TPR) repeat protein/tRNA A-37 threonylcarbamoyl transferase component Bud32